MYLKHHIAGQNGPVGYLTRDVRAPVFSSTYIPPFEISGGVIFASVVCKNVYDVTTHSISKMYTFCKRDARK